MRVFDGRVKVVGRHSTGGHSKGREETELFLIRPPKARFHNFNEAQSGHLCLRKLSLADLRRKSMTALLSRKESAQENKSLVRE